MTSVFPAPSTDAPRPPRVLLLPGWLDSGPGHWQSRWQDLHGFERVQQADWIWPRRGDWMSRLEETVLEDERPVVLVAHSLGCHLAAAWAAHSALSAVGGRVQAALLVAPPDLDRAEQPPQLAGWRPPVRRPLPFAATVVYSDDDPFSSADASRRLAADWGVPAWALGPRGHVNADSGLGDWPEGLARLQAMAPALTPALAPTHRHS